MSKIFFEWWAEIFAVAFMILGFVLSTVIPSAVLNYIVVFFTGMFGGRLLYDRKGKLMIPYLIILAGFLVGYLVASYYGNRNIVLVLYVLGIIFSYYLHDKKWIRDLPY